MVATEVEMAPTALLERLTRTLDTGKRTVEVPVDALGRERWRADLDERSVELRAEDDTAKFHGHAAVFDKRTWIGPPKWGFWEQVDGAAFNKTLKEADVRFLVNHNPDLVMARNTANTLSLSTDKTGLVTDAPNLDRRQSYTNDAVIALERGDLSQMSFAFRTVKDSWETLEDETELRTLLEVQLFDVSVVTYPAYEDTDAGLRGAAFDVLCRSLGFADAQRSAILAKIADGNLTVDELQAIAAGTTEPGSPTRADDQPGSSTGRPLALARRRHALLAKQLDLTA